MFWIRKWGREMRDEIINGSWQGITPSMTDGQRLLSAALAGLVTLLLIVLPNFI